MCTQMNQSRVLQHAERQQRPLLPSEALLFVSRDLPHTSARDLAHLYLVRLKLHLPRMAANT